MQADAATIAALIAGVLGVLAFIFVVPILFREAEKDQGDVK